MEDNLSAEKAKAFQEGWRAHKTFVDAIRSKKSIIKNAPKAPTKNVQVLENIDSLTLTLWDLKFLYDTGVSCE